MFQAQNGLSFLQDKYDGKKYIDENMDKLKE